jgi:bla regulator protein blaR1
MRQVRAFALLALIPYGLFGQAADSPTAAATAFTVASIKPNKSSDDRFMLRPLPGGGVTATGVTLKMLISTAYGVLAYQISGGPSWIGTERWDVEAKTEGVQGRIPLDQLSAMLRRLIEDRFQLKARREKKEMPVYALLVTKDGSKLKPHPAGTAENKPFASFGRGLGTFTDSSIVGLAFQLSTQLGRPVIDRTDLKGSYDFTLQWTPTPGEGSPESLGLAPRAEPPPPIDSSGPTIFTVLEDQLGLKLESTKGPVEVLLIDHVERPSEN